jgi:hypothetical protein
MMVGVSDEIRIRYLKNAIQKLYPLSRLTRRNCVSFMGCIASNGERAIMNGELLVTWQEAFLAYNIWNSLVGNVETHK